MFTPDLDDPQDALRFLAHPLRSVHDALDDGVSFAELTLAALPRDPHLWSHLTRYHAWHYLHGLGPQPWCLVKLANSGIQIEYEPIVVRVLKRFGSGPPHPGASAARRGFYGQQSLPLAWGEITIPASGANLIIDWGVESQTRIALALSKPIGTWRYGGQPKLQWRCWVSFDDEGQPGFVPSDGPSGLEPDLDLSEFEDVEGQIG